MGSSRTEQVSALAARVRVECAGGELRRASRAISRFYEAALAPLDLTATQFSLLVAVHLGGPIPLSRLAEALVLDRTSLYRAIKPLVRRRCLRTQPGRTGRERTATLTEAGHRPPGAAPPAREKIQARFVGALGPQGWAAFTAGLQQVVPAVQALESSMPHAARSTRNRAGHP